MGEVVTLGEFMKWLTLCGYKPGGGAGGGVTRVIAQSAVPATITGTTDPTVLATVTIPGGTLKENGSLRVIPLFSFPNNANVKNLRVTFGGEVILTTNQTAAAALQSMHVVRNRGTRNSQITFSTGNAGIASSVGPSSTFAVDTAQDVALVFSGTLANAADSITLEGYSIEVLNP